MLESLDPSDIIQHRSSLTSSPALASALAKSEHRHPTHLGEIFVGMAMQLSPPVQGKKGRDFEWSICLHDGMGIIGTDTFHRTVFLEDKDGADLGDEVKQGGNAVIKELARIAKDRRLKVCLVAIAEPIPDELKQGTSFLPDIWLRLDSIPFVISLKTAMFKALPPPSTATSASLVVAAAMPDLHPATHTATVARVDEIDHHVLVDCHEQVKLVSLLQYKESTTPQLWRRFKALSDHMRTNDISVSFFSATPQGGGVALMRHALLRLWKLVGVKTFWYVPEGHPHVFDITKRKIHNVLQGVAPPDMELLEKDKEYFEIWSKTNFDTYWRDGAIDKRIIVIDDPQVAPLIPLIRSIHPKAKIIFRSHIQIQSDLTDDPSKTQHRVWNYLHSFIKDVDLFLAHPVRFFVPKVTKDKLPVLYMPPSTDPLDGLNKAMGKSSVEYYRNHFNQLSLQQSHVEIDWSRGYVCQIARFDPSKGIDDLLGAYLSFRKQLQQLPNAPANGGPQLIIMGHGSVDDPDGSVIFEQCHDTLATPEYKLIRDDCAIVRAPPSDGLLGAILQGAWVATQLSTREGFEVKVTEAVKKRVPIIASRAGGIPLQVREGENGWLVDVGDREAVAAILIDIYTGKKKVKTAVTGAASEQDVPTDPNAVADAFVETLSEPVPKVHGEDNSSSEDFWTVGNAVKWMLLFSLMDGRAPSGDDKELLEGMGIGKPFPVKNGEENVWKMAMQEDLLEGEGVIL